ncbi:MAG: DNA alkylation repair protein [Candidatus Wildermuthbacteria bacterium]|nr:DNA alkylation repair protein [Candidatus Wildermuthbacteria bacterium]
MKIGDLYKTIVLGLKKHEDKEGAAIAKSYHKYGGYESYGLTTPVVRMLLKQRKKDIQALNCKEALVLARKFFNSHIEEHALAGNYTLQLKTDCITPTQYDYLDRLLDHFRSWSAIDGFCVGGGKVLQPLLSKYPKETLALLRKWNKSKNMWKRRASVVAFTRKVGESGRFIKEALELCENLIWAKEDLVRKAVGWCLKDVMRGDKKRVLAYVKSLRQRGVPPVITSYAVRDLKKKNKKA